MDEETLIKKLKLFIHEQFDGNIQSFSHAIGQPPTTVRSCLARNRKINVNILIGIKETFPDFDMNNLFSEEPDLPLLSEFHQEESSYNSKRKNSERIDNTDIDLLINFLKNNTINVNIKSDGKSDT